MADCGALEAGAIALSVDGKTVQSSDLAKLIWNVSETIAQLSTLFELRPGDLVMTGTPEGVGAVQPGQRLVGTVAGLTSIVVDIV